MKRYSIALNVAAVVTVLLCAACAAVLAIHSHALWWIPLAVWLLVAVVVTVIALNYRRLFTEWTARLAKRIDPAQQSAMESFPLPILLIDRDGRVMFANNLFTQRVNGGVPPLVDSPAQQLFDFLDPDALAHNESIDVSSRGRQYTAFISALRVDKRLRYVLYLLDDTQLKNDAAEYVASRPAMLQICIDNLDEATEHLRSGERSRIAGAIEIMLEDWITGFGGYLQKYSNDRFVAFVEHRHLLEMRDDRFSILRNVKTAFPEVDGNITLSIGVGEEKTLDECRHASMRALDMALSRGGDQVAVKTADGYDFFGGHSGGMAQRTRVRTRIIADALKELIISADHVYVMGHRMSDLDCIGGGVALAMVAQSLGVPSSVVVDASATMASQLIRRFDASTFVDPATACKNVSKNSLLIIVDTHTANMLESAELYRRMAQRVVLIDHHRRRVDHIEDTVLTYHESGSSSTCELIAELLPYLTDSKISRNVADALLAGIMLDTRNFVFRTGVRTFEAAAYLRQLGADTITVKKMFSEDLELYRRKSDLLSLAELYQQTAIAVSDEDYAEHRTAAAQAADDMLLIQGVVASFVVTPMKDYIQISARSYGECNVQLIMEAMGGGGHITMAATQLRDVTVAQAREELLSAIDNYFETNKQQSGGIPR